MKDSNMGGCRGGMRGCAVCIPTFSHVCPVLTAIIGTFDVADAVPQTARNAVRHGTPELL